MGKELTTLPSYAIQARSMDSLAEMIREGYDDFTERDLPRTKIAPAGAGIFIEPNLQGETRYETIDAVILYFGKKRTRWPVSDPNKITSGLPPICVSTNGKSGVGDPGGDCRICEQAKFGGDCKPATLLFILKPEQLIPNALYLPRTSMPFWDSYKTLLLQGGFNYWEVITKIGLTNKQSKMNPNIQYSVAQFASKYILDRPKDSELLDRLGQYKAMFKGLADSMGYDEYIIDENNANLSTPAGNPTGDFEESPF